MSARFFYYRSLVRGKKVVDCAVLREMILTAREVFSQPALDSKLYEVGKQEKRNREELARKNEERKNKLEAAEKTIVRHKGDVRGSSQSTKRRATGRERNSGSRENSNSNCSLEVRSPTHKKGEGKYNVCKLCRIT